MTSTIYDHLSDPTAPSQRPRPGKGRGDETGDLHRTAIEDMEWDESLREDPKWRADVWDNPLVVLKHNSGIVRRERRWIGFVLWFVSILVVIAVIVGSLVGFWVIRQVNPPGAPGAPVVFTVNDKDTLVTVAHRLKDQGIITHAGVFEWYVARKGGLKLTPGYYQIKPRDTMGNVMGRLKTPPQQTYTKVVFPEGFTLDQIGRRLSTTVTKLSADAFQTATSNGSVTSQYLPPGSTDMEGLLFPDTYQVSNSETETQIAQRMAKQMERVGRQVGLDTAPDTLKLTPYQVIIVASIIEKEAKTEVDRHRIAQVIYNRLAAGVPLQIDATLFYKAADPTIGATALQAIDTPYNTYMHAGLPPTPISNPGKKALRAAMTPSGNPSPNDPLCKDLPKGVACQYMFYVLHDAQGNHIFAVTAAQHAANVAYAKANGLLG